LRSFFVSWAAQGHAELVLRRQQAAHGQFARLSNLWASSGTSTLENWQSEFVRLFSFMVVSAVLIHHTSCETKDGTERTERAVAEIRTMQRDACHPAVDPLTALRAAHGPGRAPDGRAA
jgi:hypothetical protein